MNRWEIFFDRNNQDDPGHWHAVYWANDRDTILTALTSHCASTLSDLLAILPTTLHIHVVPALLDSDQWARAKAGKYRARRRR